MGTIVLIDGSSLIFRAFYAIRELTTKDGIYTNGVYGFLNMYYRIVDEYKPEYVCVAFDKSGPTFREEDYAAYKGNRQETPSELSTQFGILKDLLDSMGVVHSELDGYEADDICGTLGKLFADNGHDVVLVTGDRDFLQLVGDRERVVLTKKGITEIVEFDMSKVQEEYGIRPKQFIDVKGLMGDVSDNIPGIPGVGEKTALKLVREYGTIDGIYENLESISGKALKQKLTENKDMAILSKKLGEILLDIPIVKDLNHYKLREVDEPELKKKFERLEFRTFASRFSGLTKSATVEVSYVQIDELVLRQICKKLETASEVTFKLLYEDSNYTDSTVVAFGMSIDDEDDVYVSRFFDESSLDREVKQYSLFDSEDITEEKSIKKDVSEVGKSLEFRFGTGELRRLLANEDHLKISYDIKSDLYYLLSKGIDISNYRDAMICDYLIDPSQTGMSVDKQLEKHINITIPSLDEFLGKGKKRKPFEDIEDGVLFSYLASLISGIRKLNSELEVELENRSMTKLYEEVELPLIKVLTKMELSGFEVDVAVLNKLGAEFAAESKKLEESIYSDAGMEFNINSPKQLGEVLFDKLKLPVIKKTKTGYSTDAEVLEKLSEQNDIVNKILSYRSLTKLSGTYIDGLIPLIKADGRIHSTFKQNIAATGRISSTEPNLQNIPIKTEEGRKIRKAFVAKEGYSLIDADYSQIELRVLAHLSDDETMIRAFINDEDIHTKTASEVFNTPMNEVTTLQRSRAKAVNFGIVYGISDYGLSRDLGIPRAEAKQYIDGYLDTYPGIKEYMDSIIKQGKKDGYVGTIMNRRRYIPELSSKNFNIRGFGERIALNTPIQGSAADIIKIAMVEVDKKLADRGMKSRLILQVHDELIVEAPEDEVEEASALLKETMENAWTLSIPLKVDINIGKSWYESK